MKDGINNMFNHKHYVPILKWKRAEQGALETLSDEQKKYITPLIQLVMPSEKKGEQLESIITRFKKQISEISEKILKTWGKNQAFIDVSLLFSTELKISSLKQVISGGLETGMILVPVVHLNDDHTIIETACSLAKKYKSSVCLRLICNDFVDMSNLNKKLKEFISSSELTERNLDLLVDIKDTEGNGDKYNKYLELSQKIYNLLKWRTFTFASGAFPKDLSECKIDDENIIPRLGWNNWLIKVRSNELQRKPTFADYTIQYPIYSESSQFFHPTTSIKYTLSNEWLIMKGKKQEFGMYLASAAVLVTDEKFYGEHFSDGDKYIAEKAKHFKEYNKNPAIKGTGSTETWLKAGINHHLTLVAHQIANLS